MSSNRFKSKAKVIEIKNRLNYLIIKSLNEDIDYDGIVRFTRKYQLIINDSLEEYVMGYQNNRRILIVSFVKILISMNAIRFGMSSLFDNKWIYYLMADPTYIPGNKSLVSMMLCLASICILFIGNILQNQEMRRKSQLFIFLYRYKYQSIIRMNPLNTKRLALIMNLMTKHLMKQTFWPLVLITFIAYNIASIIAYLDPKSGFSLWLSIFWSFIFFIFLIQMYAMVSIGFVEWILSTLYLKYKFNEINAKILKSFRFQNNLLLLNAIKEHNSISKQTKQLNEFFSLMIYFLYNIATPALMILIYLTHEKDTNFYIRFVFSFIFCLVFLSVFLVNLFSSKVSNSSHKSYNILFKFLTQKRFLISLKVKLKINGLIEKLSGPDIGFYCWNLFPMNNYNFYEYVCNCFYIYFLILSLINFQTY